MDINSSIFSVIWNLGIFFLNLKFRDLDQSSSDEETSDAGNPENDTSTTVEISSPLQAEASAAEDHKPVKKSPSFINSYPLCKACGQKHKVSENHEYDYAQVGEEYVYLCQIGIPISLRLCVDRISPGILAQ